MSCVQKSSLAIVKKIATSMIGPKDFLFFANFWIKAVFFKKKEPLIGSVILTDRCNLNCKHCSVKNITAIRYAEDV